MMDLIGSFGVASAILIILFALYCCSAKLLTFHIVSDINLSTLIITRMLQSKAYSRPLVALRTLLVESLAVCLMSQFLTAARSLEHASWSLCKASSSGSKSPPLPP